MRVTVIGGGIAGSSLAYFLARGGARVTLVDAGEHTASHVPAALLNPVRGQSGQVDAQALAGLAATWALLDELSAAGVVVPHGREGVLRPLPDEKTRRKFERHLPAELPHEWRDPADCLPADRPLAPGWHAALWLPTGGWVDGRAFCTALQQASGAEMVRGRAVQRGDEWLLQNGEDLSPLNRHPSTIIHCGGSIGSTWAGETRTHRMGTMLLLDRAPTASPLSFGAYLSPTAEGGALGGTFEAPRPAWQEPALPFASLHWLLGKGTALTSLRGLQVTGRWTGSRLSGLQVGQDEAGHWHLSGLSSKGFLLGPLLARELAEQVLSGQKWSEQGAAPASHLR